jgi:hypothetical protein
MPSIRSRKVRRILRLEAQAARLQRQQARTQARADLYQRRLTASLDEARALEVSLTGGQLGELGRGRMTTTLRTTESGEDTLWRA